MLRSLPINSFLIKNVTEQKEGLLIYILFYVYMNHIVRYMYITFRYTNTFDTIPILVISYSRRERGSNIKYIISKQRVTTYRHVT